jgi:hypothetical protein
VAAHTKLFGQPTHKPSVLGRIRCAQPMIEMSQNESTGRRPLLQTQSGQGARQRHAVGAAGDANQNRHIFPTLRRPMPRNLAFKRMKRVHRAREP